MTTTNASSPIRNTATSDPAQDELIAQWSRGGEAARPAPADMRTYRAVASAPPPSVRVASGAGRRIIVGVILLTVGVLVTSVTYNAAEGGGTYVLAWGPIVYGLISLVRGLAAIGRD